MKKKKPEIVAPAGSLEKLKYAFEYGADAVYCGIPDFSLRARINMFGPEEVIEGIRYAHKKGKKVYVTTNIFAHNQHINNLPKYLKIFKKELPDAFIASDPGVIATIKKELPKAKIHLSTQANCTNWQAAQAWYKQGVKRVVLAREVSLKEMKEIKKRVPKLELEVFVHGAMCMAYSGRCLLSAWMSGRSANLGDCAQSCRWKYDVKGENFTEATIVEETRPNEDIPVEEDQHGTYIMNSKDLCLIDYLKDLDKAGIDSFKIEGRAKSVHYVSTVAKAYRMAIDANYKPSVIEKAKDELYKNVNREYTNAFIEGNFGHGMQNYANRSVGSDWEFVGQVTDVKGDEIFIKPHNALHIGEEIEIVQPKADNIKMKVIKIINATNGKEVDSMHGGVKDLFVMDIGQKVEPMSILRKKK